MEKEIKTASPYFSFVLPAWKKEFIHEAISSILGQTYTNFELIIVDDHSPEDIRTIVNIFQDNRIKYIRNSKNIGSQNLVAQWNKCLSYAKGDYIILATDDDMYSKDFLETFSKLIIKYPKVNVFRSRILSIDSDGKILGFDRCYKELLSQGEFLYRLLDGMKGGIPQFIFKRAKLLEIGGFIPFDMAWGSDDATALKCANNGIVNSQEMLVAFRWSDINISNRKDRTTEIRKASARLELCKWLKEEIKEIEFSKNPIEQFCKEMTIDRLNIVFKQILLKEWRRLNLFDFIRQILRMSSTKLLSTKDLLSIAFHYIKK